LNVAVPYQINGLIIDASVCGAGSGTNKCTSPWITFIDESPIPENTIDNIDYAVFSSSDVSTTPLPAAPPLFASGLGGLGLFGLRKKRKASAIEA
jgi:hypothetical protein